MAHDFASRKLGHTRRDGRQVGGLETRYRPQIDGLLKHGRTEHALAQGARKADGHVGHGLHAARQEYVRLPTRRCSTREQLAQSVAPVNAGRSAPLVTACRRHTCKGGGARGVGAQARQAAGGTWPVLILSTPVPMATLELMHARVTVCAGVLRGIPAAMAASRAILEVKTSWITVPQLT